LHRHDRGSFDGVRVVEAAEREAERGPGALPRRGRRAVAEPRLVVTEPVPDVVAPERLGRLVRAEQPHALGGIAVTVLAGIIPIGHVVFSSSSPPCARRRAFVVLTYPKAAVS
jgi:hypothetical protein